MQDLDARRVLLGSVGSVGSVAKVQVAEHIRMQMLPASQVDVK